MQSTSIDQGTIDRAIDGDKEAYAALVRARGSRSLIVAERILRSPEDAVTAARKLFVLAHTNLKKLKELGAVEMWLMQNLVRLCGESLKEAPKKGNALLVECDLHKGLAEAGLLDTVGALDAVGGVPSAMASAAVTRREVVGKAVDCLPFLERTAVIFRDWDGMSYLEVADILRVSHEDVRKLLVRGRKGVSEMLTPRAGEVQCGKIRDKIWLLVGGEVGPTENAAILAHIGACPSCSGAVRSASIVLEAIRDAAPLEDKPLIAPEMLWKEVEPLLGR